MRCQIFCVAESIDVVSMERSKLFEFETNAAKDMSIYRGRHDVFIFANGTIVCWSENDDEDFSYIKQFSPFFNQSLEKPIHEKIPYLYTDDDRTSIIPSEELNNDVLLLNNDDKMLKLALSYGLSRSIKLKYLEHILEAIINKYAPLARALSNKGSLKISRRGILKIIGELMTTKSDLNLANNFSYIPSFFWQNPHLEQYYVMVQKYMDIEIRALTLNDRLNTLNEIFSLLNSYIEYKHSFLLEIAITVFVGIEVVFNFLNFHF